MQCIIPSYNCHFHAIQNTKKQNLKGICFIFINNLVGAAITEIGVAIFSISIN